MTGAVASPRPRLSLEALQHSRAAKAWFGVALVAIVAVIVYLIVAAFTGQFANVVALDAQLPQGSNAVPIAAPVEYLNITVGKVGSETEAPGGAVAVRMEIYPRFLSRIPKGVQAQVSPLSIFGNQYVNLVAPAKTAPGHLEVGDFVSPYAGAPSSSLQGTVTQLYDLLNAVHPAQLDTALTAFATALNGEGSALGHALSGTANYLGQAVVPNLPTIQADLSELPAASQTVDRATPSILGLLSNSTVTAQTITAQENNLRTILSQGTDAVGRFGGILEQVQATLPALLNDSGPLLADITQSPTELSTTLSGLTQFASAVASQESSGPFLNVNVNLPVSNISAGVNAALGYDNPASVDQALGSAVNPPTYTAANCPSYAGERDYCGTGGSPAADPGAGVSGNVSTLSPPASSGRAQSAGAQARSAPVGANSDGISAAALAAGSAAYPYGAELNATQAVASALDGGAPPGSPALAALVLMPLLSSMTSGR